MLSDVKTIMELMGDKGPFALMAAIFAVMWWVERKEVKMLTTKVIKLSALVLASQHLGKGDK